MPVVTEAGFNYSDNMAFAPLEALETGARAVELPNDAAPECLRDHLHRLEAVAIPFPGFADGRGFSLARRLRDMGFRGRLRARGHVIADQWPLARQSGFDEVEIDDDQARRQPESHWQGAGALPDYRARLRGAAPAPRPAPAIPKGVFAETVTGVEHYTDRLFRFRITRPASFRFRSGEFVMIGLPNAEKPVFRAYSIASPAWDDTLEFFSIKVPDGPLTGHLQRVRPGDTVLMRRKPTGTLVLDALTPARRLWLFSTGTGIAPFASIIRDPETYEKFDQVILTQTCRTAPELAYGEAVVAAARDNELIGEMATPQRLVHVTSLTRESHHLEGRITTLMQTGRLYVATGLPALSAATDRAMICGSMAMLRDVRALCEAAGLQEGANSAPGGYVVERAFVD